MLAVAVSGTILKDPVFLRALQRPACAYKSPDAPVFQPSEEQQNHNIDLSVSLIDAYIRAALLKDTAAAEYVAGIGDDPQVREAYDTDCFV